MLGSPLFWSPSRSTGDLGCLCFRAEIGLDACTPESRQPSTNLEEVGRMRGIVEVVLTTLLEHSTLNTERLHIIDSNLGECVRISCATDATDDSR
jgi:hypothetical protein